MKHTKVLNLYAGIGGNRLEWNNCDITAVEYDAKIADVYSKRFPEDTVIVGDALTYLLEHYLEFDFIWVSPPCQSHSSIINSQYTRDSYKAKLPDMTLYQIILFLQGHGRKAKWCVENVKPYYTPLIPPTVIIDRHLYWSNFPIQAIKVDKEHIIKYVTVKDAPCDMGNISDKRQVIRNQVNHKVGLHIFNEALKDYNDKRN